VLGLVLWQVCVGLGWEGAGWTHAWNGWMGCAIPSHRGLAWAEVTIWMGFGFVLGGLAWVALREDGVTDKCFGGGDPSLAFLSALRGGERHIVFSIRLPGNLPFIMELVA
jgi:hypothetical protein